MWNALDKYFFEVFKIKPHCNICELKRFKRLCDEKGCNNKS